MKLNEKWSPRIVQNHPKSELRAPKGWICMIAGGFWMRTFFMFLTAVKSLPKIDVGSARSRFASGGGRVRPSSVAPQKKKKTLVDLLRHNSRLRKAKAFHELSVTSFLTDNWPSPKHTGTVKRQSRGSLVKILRVTSATLALQGWICLDL